VPPAGGGASCVDALGAVGVLPRRVGVGQHRLAVGPLDLQALQRVRADGLEVAVEGPDLHDGGLADEVGLLVGLDLVARVAAAQAVRREPADRLVPERAVVGVADRHADAGDLVDGAEEDAALAVAHAREHDERVAAVVHELAARRVPHAGEGERAGLEAAVGAVQPVPLPAVALAPGAVHAVRVGLRHREEGVLAADVGGGDAEGGGLRARAQVVAAVGGAHHHREQVLDRGVEVGRRVRGLAGDEREAAALGHEVLQRAEDLLRALLRRRQAPPVDVAEDDHVVGEELLARGRERLERREAAARGLRDLGVVLLDPHVRVDAAGVPGGAGLADEHVLEEVRLVPHLAVHDEHLDRAVEHAQVVHLHVVLEDGVLGGVVVGGARELRAHLHLVVARLVEPGRERRGRGLGRRQEAHLRLAAAAGLADELELARPGEVAVVGPLRLGDHEVHRDALDAVEARLAELGEERHLVLHEHLVLGQHAVHAQVLREPRVAERDGREAEVLGALAERGDGVERALALGVVAAVGDDDHAGVAAVVAADELAREAAERVADRRGRAVEGQHAHGLREAGGVARRAPSWSAPVGGAPPAGVAASSAARSVEPTRRRSSSKP
jgi:hypothetical protein